MTLPVFDYSLPNGGFTPRYVKNAFGIDEAIMLPGSHWKHYDWLKSIGFDVEEFTKNCDLWRHEITDFNVDLAGYIEMALVEDEAKRHRAGEDVPLFINPDRIID